MLWWCWSCSVPGHLQHRRTSADINVQLLLHTRLQISSFCSGKISYLSLLIRGINQSEIEGSKLGHILTYYPLFHSDWCLQSVETNMIFIPLQNDDISSLVCGQNIHFIKNSGQSPPSDYSSIVRYMTGSQ